MNSVEVILKIEKEDKTMSTFLPAVPRENEMVNLSKYNKSSPFYGEWIVKKVVYDSLNVYIHLDRG